MPLSCGQQIISPPDVDSPEDNYEDLLASSVRLSPDDEEALDIITSAICRIKAQMVNISRPGDSPLNALLVVSKKIAAIDAFFLHSSNKRPPASEDRIKDALVGLFAIWRNIRCGVR